VKNKKIKLNYFYYISKSRITEYCVDYILQEWQYDYYKC